MRQYALSFGVAFAGSLLLTFVVRSFARRWNLVAKPRADRWHKKPTALHGGVGIFLGFVISFLMDTPMQLEGEALLLLCSTGMFLLGLLDDVVHLKPYAKLIGQIVVSAIFTMYGMRLHWLPSEVFDQALTIFWLVGITNALNLLDNLDGLAGGIAAIAAAYLVYLCDAAGQPNVGALCAAFSGAVAGFLVFNFNPASIFMGDSGSLFLGFFLGGVTMVNSQPGMRRNVMAVLMVPVLLLLIPIVDTTLVTITRKVHGRPVSQGGRDHTSHRLVALGLSERGAALTLWGIAVLSGGVGVAVRSMSVPVAALLVPAFILGLTFLVVFVGHVKVYAPVANANEAGSRALVPTLADFAYKRRAFEVLNDLVIVVLAYYGAFLLRFDGEIVEPFYTHFRASLPTVIVVQLAAFLASGLYKGMWRYTSIGDVPLLFRSVGAAWVASILAVALIFRFEGFSRGVLVMDALLLLCGIAGSRLSFRMLRVHASRFQTLPNARRVVIYGAGDGGELLVRELLGNSQLGLIPVGFVDDDLNKQGRVIHGVRVLGTLDQLYDLAQSQRIDEIVVSARTLQQARESVLASVCERVGISSRRMRIAFD